MHVLKSRKDNGICVGLSKNISRRFKEHNAGYVKSTKGRKPFVIIYEESFATRHEARAKEKYLKSGIGREYFSNVPR